MDHLATFQPWRAKPSGRVYIPEKVGQQQTSSNRHPDTIMIRCLQAMVKNALEQPAWESRFEGSSYGS